MIKFENVTFLKGVVSKMKKEEFVKSHLDIFWKDKNEQRRKKMLSQVYELCAGPKKSE